MLYNPIQCYVAQFNVIKEHLDRSQLKNAEISFRLQKHYLFYRNVFYQAHLDFSHSFKETLFTIEQKYIRMKRSQIYKTNIPFSQHSCLIKQHFVFI